MWDSPIKIIYKDIDVQLEAGVIKAVQNASIYVDKDELLKALQYDRDQYQLGFLDGKIKAKEEIVHCKDCKDAKYTEYAPTECKWYCKNSTNYHDGSFFCSLGERKDK